MIDQLDKQTQPLPLEQKRGRGRPATGQALSNAERQRAYRERQKAQRNEKPDSQKVPYDEVVAIAQELGERCKAAEAKLRVELELGEKARKRVKELEAKLAQRNEKPADQNDKLNGVWIVESKRPGSRMWKPCGNPETNLKDARQAVDYMQFKSGSGQGEEWRAIRADGLLYWPLWAKKTKAAKLKERNEKPNRLNEGMKKIIQDVHEVADAIEGSTWRIQRKARANGKWITLKGSYWNEAQAEDALAELPNKKGAWWRIVEVKSKVED